ncbi:hypothetical protein [Sciscionella marina]|uniref:hypothetical protein n=1 Tax=Sciscionella marina TaxID=508770 RepID=UPI001F090F7A|nr:hypothetical protein [Sciscionella marina]
MAEEDACRFGRLLRRRPNQLANGEFAGPQFDTLLWAGELPGCDPTENYTADGLVAVTPGMPLRDFIDAALNQLDELHQQEPRCRPVAEAEPHHTTIRLVGADGARKRLIDVDYDLRPHHVTRAGVIPTIANAAPMATLCVPFAELEVIATELDAAYGDSSDGAEGYRTRAVHRFIRQARQHGDQAVAALDLTAGSLNQLLAYTGFGKSVVLVETLACWAAQHDVTIAFVVPNNADVIRHAYHIERSLAILGCETAVTPLMSPRSTFTAAETYAHRAEGHGPDADWVWSRLGYGCALASTATSGVDAWQPGQEACASLHAPPRGRARKDRVVACPWRTCCDKFRLIRTACTAGVIVTSHANLLLGRLQVPVDDGLGDNDQITVEELVLRRSHLVVIDEIDTFQQAAIDQSGRGLVLDHAGNAETPLRLFDEEFKRAFGRVRDEVDASVRAALFHIRFLAENYVSHLAYDRLPRTRPARRPRRGPARHWVVPRRWDAWLTARLFDLEKDTPVSAEQMNMFQSLFPGEADTLPDEPPVFEQIRPLIHEATTNAGGGAAVDRARAELDHLLEHIDATTRPTVINRILRRAILEQLRTSLHRLMANTQQLVAVGVESTEAIADALGNYGKWRVTPTGPLGRLVFAFTEHHDETGNEPTRLTTAAFGGDPHVHTLSLGDTTALALAKTRRIVLGLSATSYFPLAPHHHVHTLPRWWISDDNPGTVTIKPAPITRGDASLVKISGLDGAARREAAQLLARLLWNRELDAELRRLRDNDPNRARILLATTSYEGARHVAEGLAIAGVPAHRICLAVRPRRDAPYDPDGQIVTDAGQWLEIPADQLEEFPAVDKADILVAPLARVQRGVNIIGEDDRSALGSVWLLVRPIPLIDEPAEMVAQLQAKALIDHPGPTSDPLDVLANRRDTAGTYFENIIKRPPYFQAQPHEVKLAVVAEIVNGAIQLIGRARRGGTSAVLHLADGAFLDPNGGTSFATLISQLSDAWAEMGVLDTMRQFYGTTLDSFFAYARQNITPDTHVQSPME